MSDNNALSLLGWVDLLPEGLHKISDDTSIEINDEGMAKTPPAWPTVSITSQQGLSGWDDMNLPVTSILPENPIRGTGTSPAGSITRAWLQECVDHHGLCSDGENPKLPRRIINVSDETLRLEEPEDKQAQYATLSYGVGGAHLFTTTRDTLRWTTMAGGPRL